MSDAPIATVEGTMLVPGVSRNMRLYTKEVIAKAVNRMQARIADPNGLPIVMRTHHAADDNSVKIVGRIHSVSLAEDGSARYKAQIYNTQAGRDIAALITPKQPALKSVSIHGYWLGPLKKVQHDGESVTTGDDLEINAVDWTATPGVTDAIVSTATWMEAPSSESAESTALARTPISESVEATITTITEAVDEDEQAWDALVEATYTQKQKDQMVGSGAMRNAQGKGSYPIKNKSDLRKAIRAVGRGGANHNAIRRHIMSRARALGLSSMIPSNWNSDGSIKESETRFGLVTEYMDAGVSSGGAGGFCIDAYNGPISITLRGCGIDPGELRVIAAAAMDAACAALAAMDPDMDGDIDVAGAPHADTDDGMAGMETFSPGGVITPGQVQPYDSVPATLQPGEGVLTLEQVHEALDAPAVDASGDIAVQAGRTYEGDAAAKVIKVTVKGSAISETDLRALVRDAVKATHGTRETSTTSTTTDTPDETGESARTHEEVPAVSEATSTTQAAETTAQPARTLTDADITALGTVFAAALQQHAATTETTQTTAEKATATTAETTKADGEPEKALREKAEKFEADLNANLAARETALREALREELLAQMREELLRTTGIPTRKGFRVHENEQQAPDAQTLFEDRTNILLADFAKTPVPQPGTGFAPAPTPTQPEMPQAAGQ